MNIRVGVQLHPQHCTWDELERAIKAVDESGFDTLFTWDHFFPLYGQPGDPLHPEGLGKLPFPHLGAHFEGWTILTAMACLTKKVEFGMLVTCNTYRNPQLLADMARTIDQISRGRFILGIGSGWFERDYQEYGYEFGTAGERLKKLAANLPIIRTRLAKLSPAPVRNPMPILIGGGGEKVTLKIVAEHADIWNGFGSPDEVRHKNAVLDEHCKNIGRDPKTIERSILINAITAAESLKSLDAYVDAGITHFIYGTGTPFDLAPALKLLEWRASRLARA